MARENSLPEVGRRLSAARLQRGLSQGTVARAAGIAPSYLSRIENCKIQPTFRTVLRILNALQADLNEIVGPGPIATVHRGPCPVSAGGQCLRDLMRSETHASCITGDVNYTPREIRLLGRLARWLKTVRPDRVRAMEILLEDLMQGATEKEKGTDLLFQQK